jgi:collagenase-like PrtC family protease
MSDLGKTIKQIKGKVDAVICWDLAVIVLCKKYKFRFCSTQASISNSDSQILQETWSNDLFLQRIKLETD